MATTRKKKETATEPVESVVPKPPMVRPRQVRLTMGIALLLAGVFICFSIISYFFTWQADQDKILSNDHLFDFVFNEDTPVANWAGRMGAAVSHLLVFRGFGLASLVIGVVTAAFGLRMVYGRRSIAWFRHFRWIIAVLLIVAPVLTFLFPDAAFSFGGAVGNESISYFNGLIGKTGTGLMLLAITSFFVFVLFAVNLAPAIRKIRLSLPRPKEKIVPEAVSAAIPEVTIASTVYPDADVPKEAPPFAKAPEPVLLSDEDIIANKLKGEIDHLDIAEEEAILPAGSLDFTFTEKQPVVPVAIVPPPVVPVVPLPPVAPVAPSVMTVPDDFELEIKQPVPEAPVVPVAKPNKSQEFELEINIPKEEAAAIIPEAEEPPPFDEDFVDADDFAEDDFEDDHFDEAADHHEMEVIHTPDEKPVNATIHGSHISIASNEPYAPELDLPDYKFPTLDLLEDRVQETISLDKGELEKNKNQILSTLRSFGIEIQRISATVGPTVTLYEIVPAEGVRISKIRNLEDDIALNLAALGIRIIAPIPGRGTIGIEVPNANKQIVSMRALIASEKFVNSKMSLPVALGKKIDNELYIVDLATMPHLLMAGATGQGKSVGINAILVSLLYKKHPSQLKFVMVDPKKVELSVYKLIEKHFLAKLPNEEEAIITDTKKVIYTLNALCIEMDNRYELLKEAGTRNIKEYNEKFIKRRLNPENGHKYLPFIVLVVDEFADLIMTAGKEVEMPIARLAQLARAVGIHLIVATQRPSVNVITGTIKANFPGRIAFKVSAKVDSRTILDTGGAEQLIGRGDMLVSHGSEVFRVQCAFVDTPEVEAIVEFIGKQRGYPSAFELPEYEGAEEDGKKETIDLANKDKLFEDCARHVVQMQNGSTSNLQRRFNLGYNRAGRIMDQLEAAGVVGPAVGSKPREVYFHTDGELEQFLKESY